MHGCVILQLGTPDLILEVGDEDEVIRIHSGDGDYFLSNLKDKKACYKSRLHIIDIM